MSEMTDREMVELAAKAAGLKIEFMHEMHPIAFLDHDSDWPRSMFNPLFDDGDAFRLAAKLRIDVCYEDNDGPWHVNAWPRMTNVGCSELAEGEGATRRAIVRAAAEIGKQMP